MKTKPAIDSVFALYHRCRANIVKRMQNEGIPDYKIAHHLTLTTPKLTAFIKCAQDTTTPPFIVEPPKYMFAERPVTPSTWMELQEMQLDTYMLADSTALLVDPVTREYCYVFWDEAEQCSNPYPTQDAALAAVFAYQP